MNFTNIFKDNSAYIIYKIIKNRYIFYYAPLISVNFCKDKILGEVAFEVVYSGVLSTNKILKIEREKYLYSWTCTPNSTKFIFLVPKELFPFIESYLNPNTTPIATDVVNTLNYFIVCVENEKGEGDFRHLPLNRFNYRNLHYVDNHLLDLQVQSQNIDI